MNKDLRNFIKEIYALKHIIRYNNVSKILQESVAEHSFFVVAIVLELDKYYIFDLKRALIMATVHDFCEIYIGDVPRNIKNRYKKLAKILDEVEKETWQAKYPEYEQYLIDFEELNTPESIIVKFADALSILQYSKNEILLGNKGYMDQVYQDSKLFIKKMSKKLDKIKK